MFKKIKILYIISICLIFFQFQNNIMTIKADESLLTWENMSSNSDSNTTNGKISITNKSEDYSSSTITLPNDVQADLTDLPDGITFDSKQNSFLIDWSKVQSKSSTMELTIQILETSNSSYLVSIQSTLNNGETINDKLIIELTDDTTYPENENTSIESSNNPDSLSLIQNVTPSSDGSGPESTVHENETSQTDSQIEESSELIESESEENTIQTFAITTRASSVSVNTWLQFEDALANSNISTININNDISAPSLNRSGSLSINGDKIINAQNHILNFYARRFNIQNFSVYFNEAKVQVNQNHLLLSNENDSLFYSPVGGKLTINNVSFDGTQNGQVARVPNGEIIIQGKSYFEFKGPYEVFEANGITFESNSIFEAHNNEERLLNSNLRELINLYGDATINIEDGAQVMFALKDRMNIINNLDNARTTINIAPNAKVSVIAGNVDTNDGQPLINLQGGGSSINIAEGATLDIRNNRTQKPGALISMNGSINFNSSSKKIEYWNQGASIDTNITSGQNYIKFPRVYDGIMSLSGSIINNISVNSSSSLSKSDNSALNEIQISNLLLKKPTNEIKRLLISSAESIEQPNINRLTDTDVKLSGTTYPGFQVKATDGQDVWTTIADSTSGKFELDLGTFAPYKVGSKINVIVTDGYGAQSEPLEVTVAGNRLSFNAPSTLEFQQVAVKDEQMTIQRTNPNWQIKVINTKEYNPEAPWKLTARASEPLKTQDGHTLRNALVFKKDTNTYNIEAQTQLIYQQDENDPQEKNVFWTADQGLLLELNPIAQDVAYYKPYTTTIEWTLTDAP
ncbi:pectate lyase-like adhesive domain-containing protein [Aerococcus urinaeequi]|uniref:Bacterial Ig domain-containing protein n=1 Tax=Aerococcus urinaeequi TaxID=51665 RepID=A0AAC8WZH6_9LACT|nr:pectate lyase-like adhesive domain-containing protein [Aerococcus urinaeequi]AMB97015.1 hypothetical protein AWM74_01640 [Aerococcus urinaeequi]